MGSRTQPAPEHRGRLGEVRALVHLALPTAVIFGGGTFMTAAETAIVGHSDTVMLAGFGIGSLLYTGITIVGTGVMLGLDPMLSQALGARSDARGSQLLWQAIWLAGIVTALALPLLFVTPLVLSRLSIDAEVERCAREYMWLRAIELPAFFLYTAFRTYLQAVGQGRPLYLSILGANVVNLLLLPVLVFGGSILPSFTGPLAGMPALGVGGVALAAVAGTLFETAYLARAASREVRRRTGEPLFARWRRPVREDLRLALRTGWASGLVMGADVLMFAIAGIVAGRLGTEELAAHQLALVIVAVSFAGVTGLGSAGSIRVGLAIGAGDPARTRRAGLVAIALAAGLMVAIALIVLLVPELLVSILTDRAEVARIAVPTLMVVAVFQLFDGIQAVGVGVLRGAGDTRFAFMASLLGYYAVGLPLAIVLGVTLELGLPGMWAGISAGVAVMAVMVVLRFLSLASRPIRAVAPGVTT